MLKRINGLSVFLSIMIIALFGAFYYVIEKQERPQYKPELSRIIREDFFKHKTQYAALANFALNAHSKSSDWYLDNRSGDSLQYISESSPAIPDFKVPAEIRPMMDTLQLALVRYEHNEMCEKRLIALVYKTDLYAPDGRTVMFRYFPDGMCKEMLEEIKKSDNKWNWSFFLDKNWIATSVKKKH